MSEHKNIKKSESKLTRTGFEFQGMKDSSESKALFSKNPGDFKSNGDYKKGFKKTEFIAFFVDYGFPKTKIKQIIEKCPKCMKRSIEDTIKPILTFLESKDFTKKEIIQLAVTYPKIFQRSRETLERRYSLLKQRIPNHVKNVVLKNPAILACGDQAIRDRLDVYSEIAYHIGMETLLSNPLWLSFGPDTVKNRFDFLMGKGSFPPGGQFYLFMSKSRFLGNFGINAFLKCHPNTSQQELKDLQDKAECFKIWRKKRSWN